MIFVSTCDFRWDRKFEISHMMLVTYDSAVASVMPVPALDSEAHGRSPSPPHTRQEHRICMAASLKQLSFFTEPSCDVSFYALLNFDEGPKNPRC